MPIGPAPIDLSPDLPISLGGVFHIVRETDSLRIAVRRKPHPATRIASVIFAVGFVAGVAVVCTVYAEELRAAAAEAGPIADLLALFFGACFILGIGGALYGPSLALRKEQRRGDPLHFDRGRGLIVLPRTGREVQSSSVRGLWFASAHTRDPGSHGTAYSISQLSLIVATDGDTPALARIPIVTHGALGELLPLGEALAAELRVPFEKHRLESELAPTSAELSQRMLREDHPRLARALAGDQTPSRRER